MPKAFLDTNVLAYAADCSLPDKQSRARSLLRELAENSTGVVSTQVLQEFYVTATKKLGIDPLQAKDMVRAFGHYEVVTITPGLIGEAIDCSLLAQLSFWDALIVVAAESARCSQPWTEDLNDGQIIRGVRVRHPF